MGDVYRLYIDESGNHKYHNYTNPRYDNLRDRYLALMGVFIKHEEYREVHGNLEALKARHFRYDPDYPLILHRADIMHKRRSFGVLSNPEKESAFNEDLLQFIRELPCLLILVVMDKMKYKNQYKNPFHPYHFSFAIMLERYCGYLNFINKQGDVMAESRGGHEDRLLKDEYRKLYIQGTGFHVPADFQNTLTSKEIKLTPKEKNIAGIQIADILANPCRSEFLAEKGRIGRQEASFGRLVCEAVRDKFNKQIYSGQVEGYGKILLE